MRPQPQIANRNNRALFFFKEMNYPILSSSDTPVMTCALRLLAWCSQVLPVDPRRWNNLAGWLINATVGPPPSTSVLGLASISVSPRRLGQADTDKLGEKTGFLGLLRRCHVHVPLMLTLRTKVVGFSIPAPKSNMGKTKYWLIEYISWVLWTTS